MFFSDGSNQIRVLDIDSDIVEEIPLNSCFPMLEEAKKVPGFGFTFIAKPDDPLLSQKKKLILSVVNSAEGFSAIPRPSTAEKDSDGR